MARGRAAIGDGVATLAAMQTGRDLAFASVGEGPSSGLWGTRAYGADVAGLFADLPEPGRETAAAPDRWLEVGAGAPSASSPGLEGGAYLDASATSTSTTASVGRSRCR